MDYTNRFVVYNKTEILKLENRIEELAKENEKLKHINEKCKELEFENIKLKNKLKERQALEESAINDIDNSLKDQNKTAEFIEGQESTSGDTLKVHLMHNLSTVAAGHLYDQTDEFYVNHEINTGLTDLSDDSSHIAYVRRQSTYNIRNEKPEKYHLKLNKAQKEHKLLESVWSFPNFNSRNGLSNLSTEMKNKCDKNIMFKIISKEWNQKPENMSRIEFFYHLLSVFIENGVLIRFCTEHSPPCSPRIDSKIFEKNADVLKSFISCINRFKLIIIEVELLVALENIVYNLPKYRSAISDVMDILFRKGVVEAIAFSEWSQMDSQRIDDKIQLIREIKASGFSLLKRSSSV